jgi:hypothetical protein
LFTIDRAEIESLRMIEAMIRNYDDVRVQKKPLSIGVFGPPGAGKSFGVKALAEGILGSHVPFLEFNLSQFDDPGDLIGPMHRVRDAVLGGLTPVVFWDEFDSQQYRWLQYLLAPMQDGAFQDGQLTHPIGKCVFVFAGGTAATLDSFGVPEAPPIAPDQRARLSASERREREELERRYEQFKLLKGPDFVSRLHGFLNVLGPNPRTDGDHIDITYPIRRALLLRTMLGLGNREELSIDAGLLRALLRVSTYRHGARSFEKIVGALGQASDNGRLYRAALPPDPILNRETDAEEFWRIVLERDRLRSSLDVDVLAALVHLRYREGAERSKAIARAAGKSEGMWAVHPEIQKDFDALSEDAKASNRAAARRLPDLLALVDFRIVPQESGDDGSWRKPLEKAIHRHIVRLAQAEHLGWWAERMSNGWTPGPRDNALKRHPLLVEWSKLPPVERDKDVWAVLATPDLLAAIGHKAIPVGDIRRSPRQRRRGSRRRVKKSDGGRSRRGS